MVVRVRLWHSEVATAECWLVVRSDVIGTVRVMARSWRRRQYPWPRPPRRHRRRHHVAAGRPVAPLTELGRVPSPGGWIAPPGVLPGWNWGPPEGIVPRPDRAPRWVRWWYATPFIDRYAHAWMWWHGAWDVFRAQRESPAAVTPQE